MSHDNPTSTVSGGDEPPFSQSGITWGGELAIKTGIDRLKVGFYCLFRDRLFFESWADVKMSAKEKNEPVPISFSDHGDMVFNMHPTGRRGGFGFHLSRADVDLFFSTRKDIKTPNLWVDIGSESCWSPGWREILDDVKFLVESLGGEIWKNTVSEVHLAADFIGADLQSLPVDKWDHWVSRANRFDTYRNHHGLEGVNIAQDEGLLPGPAMTGIEFGRGDIMLRIYDKTAELKRSPAKQAVFASVWNLPEYDAAKTTRVEYQLRRPVLLQMKVNTLADLQTKRNEIWLYCTQEWTRFHDRPVDRANRHQDRVKLHPWWQIVTQADISLESEALKRERPRPTKDISQLMDQVGGCLLTVGTILDQRCDDLEGLTHYATKLVASKLKNMWENKDHKGRRELETKMKKRYSQIWPMGFEPQEI